MPGAVQVGFRASEVEPQIEAAYQAMLAAQVAQEVTFHALRMTALILARNDARTPEEIAEIERARGLR